eukprot:2652183-Rhodomonas_salina.2
MDPYGGRTFTVKQIIANRHPVLCVAYAQVSTAARALAPRCGTARCKALLLRVPLSAGAGAGAAVSSLVVVAAAAAVTAAVATGLNALHHV